MKAKNNKHPEITGLILAGGKSRRMQGQDKSFVPLNAKPLIEHLLDAYLPQIDHCVISANRNLERYQSYGYPIYKDTSEINDTPLAGLAIALKHCKTEWMVCVPCDAVTLPNDFVEKLYKKAQNAQSVLVVAKDSERVQPLYALLNRSLLAELEAFIASGQRRVMSWVESQNCVIADFSDDGFVFQNINRAEDLQSVSKQC